MSFLFESPKILRGEWSRFDEWTYFLKWGWIKTNTGKVLEVSFVFEIIAPFRFVQFESQWAEDVAAFNDGDDDDDGDGDDDDDDDDVFLDLFYFYFEILANIDIQVGSIAWHVSGRLS